MIDDNIYGQNLTEQLDDSIGQAPNGLLVSTPLNGKPSKNALNAIK